MRRLVVGFPPQRGLCSNDGSFKRFFRDGVPLVDVFPGFIGLILISESIAYSFVDVQRAVVAEDNPIRSILYGGVLCRRTPPMDDVVLLSGQVIYLVVPVKHALFRLHLIHPN